MARIPAHVIVEIASTAEAPAAARLGPVESSGVVITTYGQHTGKFQYPNGEIGGFSAASDMAENWVDLMLGPKPL